MSDIILCTKKLSKKYNENDGFVLKDFDFELFPEERVALLGQSGCGKSTLLHLLCGLDSVSSGSLFFKNIDLAKCSEDKLTDIRCKHFGFVYQFHNLLQEFTAKENIMIPLLINGKPKKEASEKAEELLNLFNLSDKLNSLPSELSGGQRQRVAIARGISNTPTVLLADEPTGNLDINTSQIVMEELLNVLEKFKISAIIATHNLEIANMLSRKFILGKI